MSSGKELGLGGWSTAKQVLDTFGTEKYLHGKTAIITGGNSGIGLETAKALASAGAKVILCSRSVKAGEEAVKQEVLQNGLGGYRVTDPSLIQVAALDLSSLASVKSFANEFLTQHSSLDLLVLNAGIMALPQREETDAGFEKQIGVNHFGHFYLTQLLIDCMKRTVDLTKDRRGRVVVLSSVAHQYGSVKPEDLHYTKGRQYKPWEAYGQSKLANLLFAKGLADRLKGTGITAVSVHPGVIATNLWRQSFINRILGKFIKNKSIPQGAATTIYACVAPRVDTDGLRGAYLSDCGSVAPNKEGLDEDGQLRNQLWEATEKQLAVAVEKAGLA